MALLISRLYLNAILSHRVPLFFIFYATSEQFIPVHRFGLTHFFLERTCLVKCVGQAKKEAYGKVHQVIEYPMKRIPQQLLIQLYYQKRGTAFTLLLVRNNFAVGALLHEAIKAKWLGCDPTVKNHHALDDKLL